MKYADLAAFAAYTIAGPASASTLLLSDNFNTGVNNWAGTFNADIATSQGGTLAGTAGSQYSVARKWRAQHGANIMTVSSLPVSWGGYDYGSVSVNNDFAVQANAANQALQVSFNVLGVSYGGGTYDASYWTQFNIGSAQHVGVNSAAATVGIDFKVNGASEVFRSGGSPDVTTFAGDDLITVTLSDGAGGSAFNGNGSVANVKFGTTNIGTTRSHNKRPPI